VLQLRAFRNSKALQLSAFFLYQGYLRRRDFVRDKKDIIGGQRGQLLGQKRTHEEEKFCSFLLSVPE